MIAFHIMLIKICLHVTFSNIRQNWPIIITHPDPDWKPHAIWNQRCKNDQIVCNILTPLLDGKSVFIPFIERSSSEWENERQQHRPTTKTSSVKYTQTSFCFSLALQPFITRQISHATFSRSTLCCCSISVSFSWNIQCETVFLLHRYAHAHCAVSKSVYSCLLVYSGNAVVV